MRESYISKYSHLIEDDGLLPEDPAPENDDNLRPITKADTRSKFVDIVPSTYFHTPEGKKIADVVSDKFEKAHNLLNSVILKETFPGAILSEAFGGIGKSTLVKNVLENSGLKENENYLVLGPGKISPIRVKDYMKENPHSIIILDDIDDIWTNDLYDKILKGALGPEREVTYGTNAGGDVESGERPDTFKFDGKIIIITNWNREDIEGLGYGPLMSRIAFIDLNLDRLQTAARVIDILPELAPDVGDQVSLGERGLIVDELYKQQSIKFSPRSVEAAIRLKRDYPSDWKEYLDTIS